MAGLTCLASGTFKYGTLETFGSTEGSTPGADPCKSGGEIPPACSLPTTGAMWHKTNSESGML